MLGIGLSAEADNLQRVGDSKIMVSDLCDAIDEIDDEIAIDKKIENHTPHTTHTLTALTHSHHTHNYAPRAHSQNARTTSHRET